MKGKTVRSGVDANDSVRYKDVFLMNQLQYLHATWDPGVRLTVGWNSSCDGWDLNLFWTYYHNSKKASSTVPSFSLQYPEVGNIGLVNPWGIVGVGEEHLIWQTISAEWKYTFNSLDLELGKRYWLSKCFTLRPFTGIRSAWTSTDFDLSSLRNGLNSSAVSPSSGSLLNTTSENAFHNTFWGVGFLGGIQPTWFFTPCFSLFASGDVSLLWGGRGLKRKDAYTQSQTSVQTGLLDGPQYHFKYRSKNSNLCMMQPILDLALGIRWENYYCDSRYHLAIDLGWENHTLFNHNYRFQYKDADHMGDPISSEEEVFAFDSYNETVHNVSFGGLVIRARFDF